MRTALAFSLLAALLCTDSAVRADEVGYPKPPGEREFILDEAGLISTHDAEEIKRVCTALLDEKRVPIIVVTLRSIGDYTSADWTIARYARSLFDEWGIGFPEWNHGMLLLVSKGDRTARIELGAAWGHEQDLYARRIMDDEILANFKRGRFSAGLLAGVKALANVARGLGPPTRPQQSGRAAPGDATPWYEEPLWWGAILFVVGSLMSIARGGRSSWGYKAWSVLFMILGAILMFAALFGLAGGRGGRSSGGGGGSFGGGSSGGGGASGSW